MLNGSDRSSFSKSQLLLMENIENELQGQSFWCPILPETLIVRGDFTAKNFDYVSVKLRGCNLGSACFGDKIVRQTPINYLGVVAHPSLDGGDNIDDVIMFAVDQTYYKFLDP